MLSRLGYLYTAIPVQIQKSRAFQSQVIFPICENIIVALLNEGTVVILHLNPFHVEFEEIGIVPENKLEMPILVQLEPDAVRDQGSG
jgi:hypothetical protein